MKKHRYGSKRSSRKWTKGTMHRALKVPQHRKISIAALKMAARSPGVVGKRARFLLNVRGVKTKHIPWVLHPRSRYGKRGKWIQKAHIKKGALHRQLRIPVGKKIPLSILRKAAKAKGKLGKRARLALNFRKMRKK